MLAVQIHAHTFEHSCVLMWAYYPYKKASKKTLATYFWHILNFHAHLQHCQSWSRLNSAEQEKPLLLPFFVHCNSNEPTRREDILYCARSHPRHQQKGKTAFIMWIFLPGCLVYSCTFLSSSEICQLIPERDWEMTRGERIHFKSETCHWCSTSRKLDTSKQEMCICTCLYNT